MGSATSKIPVTVPESYLIGFEVNRPLYFWIILIISVLALTANLLAIRTVIHRKYKYLQKTCIISLAISDILSVTLFALNNLDLLRKKPMYWIYGEFLCHFIPVGQVLGNLSSSIALLVIALDRYHNVVHALSKKWNPALWKCLGATFLFWIVCTGISYPVVTFYLFIPILVNGYESALCSGAPITKSLILIYYTCMTFLFFTPIVIMFFWFYYKIAQMIWKHRKPPSEAYSQEITETSTATRTTTIDASVVTSKIKKKNVQMERKVRSFKIVVSLIVAFIGCRLPYWMLMLYQQVNLGDNVNIMWNIRFCCIAVYLFNCLLNPFLYTFLNFTIVFSRKFSNIVTTICCCWCSDSEFKDFEAGKPMAECIIIGVNNAKNECKPNVTFLNVPIELPQYARREIF
ncbi:somatostatin receptor type 3-like [Anthonomus grandis grandis]|uniref:somatostatin receptor type 3-like n=1 Tax=Anthonomus grandis grandis TaxID=2921223 RepID=UPI00216663CC|nr:somatostatin receptor type 3-like [Anthonomus grandis grandis]